MDQQEDSQKQEEVKPQISPPAEEKSSHDASKKEIEQAIEGAQDVLMEITAPMQIFPTSIKLDRSKITIHSHKLVHSRGVLSLPIEDVMNVMGHGSTLFGYVTIEQEVVTSEEAYRFGPFWRDDARKFGAMAQGYVVALKRKIDLNALSTPELKEMLQKLGEP